MCTKRLKHLQSLISKSSCVATLTAQTHSLIKRNTIISGCKDICHPDANCLATKSNWKKACTSTLLMSGLMSNYQRQAWVCIRKQKTRQVTGWHHVRTVQHLFWSQLKTTAVFQVKPPEGILLTLFEITLCFYWDHYHKYCLWQNQFPCFVLCGAVSAKCCILSPRSPLHRSPHEIKQEWKLEQEIEKRGPVVLRRPLCLLLFPLNMPVSYAHQMYVCPF